MAGGQTVATVLTSPPPQPVSRPGDEDRPAARWALSRPQSAERSEGSLDRRSPASRYTLAPPGRAGVFPVVGTGVAGAFPKPPLGAGLVAQEPLPFGLVCHQHGGEERAWLPRDEPGATRVSALTSPATGGADWPYLYEPVGQRAERPLTPTTALSSAVGCPTRGGAGTPARRCISAAVTRSRLLRRQKAATDSRWRAACQAPPASEGRSESSESINPRRAEGDEPNRELQVELGPAQDQAQTRRYKGQGPITLCAVWGKMARDFQLFQRSPKGKEGDRNAP